jgi:hypothetical protein
MHGYATDQSSPSTAGYPPLSELLVSSHNSTTSILSRLKRIRNALSGNQGLDKPDGPREVSMGAIPSLSASLTKLSMIEDECYGLEQVLGLDTPPQSPASNGR